MSSGKVKRNLKNVAKTIPKAVFKGSMYVGRETFKAVGSIAKNKYVKEIATTAAVITAAVAFAPQTLMVAGIVGAVKSVTCPRVDFTKESIKMFNSMRDLASIPTEMIADILAETAKVGEKLTQKGIDATR